MNLRDFKKSFYSALVFFGTIIILSVWYGALFGGLSTADKVNSGSGLTAISWNRIVDGVLDINTRLENLSFSGGNIGIGTASPGAKLEVNGDVKALNLPKAWVTFNGVTMTVYDSYGVASVSRSPISSFGVYKINWLNSFSNTYYIVTGACNAYGFSGTMFTIEGNSIPGDIYQALFTWYANVGCRVSSTNAYGDSNLITVVAYGR